ncbi:hypothetical protein KSP39_PZI018403 [Platanthera zijinensis]|uniref:Uncharacterized protein n=1 Tax=Platanthera zijinensis TaxID=2320716 RepID=A0AAP0FZ51_9ASPA
MSAGDGRPRGDKSIIGLRDAAAALSKSAGGVLSITSIRSDVGACFRSLPTTALASADRITVAIYRRDSLWKERKVERLL